MVLLTDFNHEAQGLPLPTVFSHGSVPAVQMPRPMANVPNRSKPGAIWQMSIRGTQPHLWHRDSWGNGAGVENGAGSIPMSVPKARVDISGR